MIGGHDIRADFLRRIGRGIPRGTPGVFEADWLAACRDELAAASARVRPGTQFGAGKPIAKLGRLGRRRNARRSVRQAVDRIAADLAAFVEGRVDRPPDRPERRQHRAPVRARATSTRRWDALNAALADGGARAASRQLALCPGRARERATPTSTSRPAWAPRSPPSTSWPQSTGALYAGKDGKTGETLMKTVLAPMFAARNLKVMSWVGHNIFGNRDGLVLDDPANKASKVETKDQVVTEILGYKPEPLVTIEYIPDMGDWKTAWDHIHFQGFLGTKMTLQFTWQGCDSLLAAPLAIDLARLADLEKRRGGTGLDAPPRLLLQEPRRRRGARLLQAVRHAGRVRRARSPSADR